MKNVKDLVGKKIGLAATGTDCDLMTKSIMKANAVEFDDVTFSYTTGNGEQTALLIREQVGQLGHHQQLGGALVQFRRPLLQLRETGLAAI